MIMKIELNKKYSNGKDIIIPLNYYATDSTLIKCYSVTADCIEFYAEEIMLVFYKPCFKKIYSNKLSKKIYPEAEEKNGFLYIED